MTPDANAARIQTTYSIVDADFFETLEIALVAGRGFEPNRGADLANMTGWRNDDPTLAPDYNIIVDRALVERMGLPHPEAALGRVIYRVAASGGSRPRQRLHIIGVVAGTKIMPMNLGFPSMYLMNPQAASVPVIRIAKTNVAAALAGVDASWKALAPEVPLKRRFADEQYQINFQFLDVLNNAVAGVAIFAGFIAVMGLVGMSLHITRRRTHEIGVRKTLGASVPQVLWLLLSRMSAPVVISNLLVWPLVYVVMSGYLSLYSSRVGLTPVPFLFSLMLTLSVACLAVVAQATRAARLKPATVLRYE